MRLAKVKDVTGWQGDVWLVKDTVTGKFYTVSRNHTFDRGDETMIFASDEDGETTDWSDLWSGYGVDHADAIASFGRELARA